MHEAVKGKAYNLQRYKQVLDYSGLRFERGITPTDVDGLLDFSGRLFVILEFKHALSELPHGQRLAFERICDALHKGNTPTTCLVARHLHPPEEEINAANAIVTEYRYNGKWLIPRERTSVRCAIEKFKALQCAVHDQPNPQQ